MFQLIKTWRDKAPTHATFNNRTWHRRIQWLEDSTDQVKLKFDVDENYFEVLVPGAFAQQVWDRFKAGQSVDDSVSIFGKPVPIHKRSRRAAKKEKQP